MGGKFFRGFAEDRKIFLLNISNLHMSYSFFNRSARQLWSCVQPAWSISNDFSPQFPHTYAQAWCRCRAWSCSEPNSIRACKNDRIGSNLRQLLAIRLHFVSDSNLIRKWYHSRWIGKEHGKLWLLDENQKSINNSASQSLRYYKDENHDTLIFWKENVYLLSNLSKLAKA